MGTEFYGLITFLLVVAAFVGYRIWIGGKELGVFWGKMLVTCPENHETAAVNVAAGKAALSAMAGVHDVELKTCSRWPEKHDCGQECLADLRKDPESHAVWTIASKWFQGKSCIYCKKPIAPFAHLDHAPALLDQQRKTIEWKEIPAEKLSQVLATALPVCWNCHVVETFRRLHPEKITERPWH